jgi:hypothetical protein
MRRCQLAGVLYYITLMSVTRGHSISKFLPVAIGDYTRQPTNALVITQPENNTRRAMDRRPYLFFFATLFSN